MTWTAANPVSVGAATKKDDFDKAWGNSDLLYAFLASCNLTDHGILVGSGAGAITPLAAATNGQLPIGSTGADPVVAALTQGAGITITNGAGSIAIAHTSHTGDVTGDAALTIGALKVLEAMINNEAVTEGKIGAGAVAAAKLKTSSGEVSSAVTGNQTLPGGEYGFFPQVKTTGGGSVTIGSGVTSTSYVTNIHFTVTSGSMYARQRYVTSSGEVYWIFILRNKTTKQILSIWRAPDHPCFGAKDPDLYPHPFPRIYDETIHEIICINPDETQLIEMEQKRQSESTDEYELSLNEVIERHYSIDEKSSPAWPDKEITVGFDIDTVKKTVEIVKMKIPQPQDVTVRGMKKK